MELPEARLFGIQGRKPTHDFLSLYSHSTAQQDPKSSSQGNYLKTHDFLQPLERAENKINAAKEEAADEISSAVPRPPPPALLPASIEHILPGGIGTYSISHMSYNNYNNQRIPKQEAPLFTVAPATSTDRNEEHSNCSSYTTGSGFTLWEEPAANKKGKTGKENHVAEKPSKGDSAAEWMLLERNSQSFSNSLSCSQTTGPKNQSLLEMLTSAKDCSQDEELDNEETLILMKESSNTQSGELRVEVDGKSTDQKPNTPRSKHSATEQRRRSKINDRFQMLRELIPHSDQKRDKASFLLEVIEYIHFLQEKVHKYEGSYLGWNRDPLEKLMPWGNNQRPAESYGDQSHGANSGSGPSSTLLFASKIDEKNITISPTNPGSTQNVESGMSTATAFKATDQHPGLMNKAMPIPFSLQPNFFTHAESGGPGGVMSQLTHGLASDAENNTHQPSLQCQPYSSAAEVTATSDKLNDRDLNIEGGAISISSMYSKELLDTLTQALQSSGVDLSMASISVQIELGKQANVRANAPTSGAKVDEVPPRNQSLTRSRFACIEESDQARKKLKKRRS